MNDEQRKALSQTAWLASAVNGIIAREALLTNEQRARLKALFAPDRHDEGAA